jgi:TRAP-type transport system periplasmic protein
MEEQRKNGAWAELNKLHNEKLNAWFLARTGMNTPFHIYLNKRIEKYDFNGLKIRVTPVYRDLVQALGGATVTTAPGEVYTALERGVVDGYGWPIQGIFDLGWHEATKFRLDPGFYNVDVNVLVNLETWRKLDDAQRKFLTDTALWLESLDRENEAINKAEIERQAKANIQPIKFSDAEAKRFVDRANEVGWQSISARNAEFAKRLKPLISD